MEKVCRVCLGSDDLSSLFTDDAIQPFNMMMMCSQVKIIKGDGFPSFICKSCVNRLRISFQFKQQCESSDQHLRQLFNSFPDSDIINTTNEHTNPIIGETENNCNKFNTSISDFKLNYVHNSHRECDENIKINTSFKKQIKIDNNTKNISKINYLKTKRKKLSMPEKCTECGKTFNYGGYLKAHLRTHSGEKPFECNICKKKFNQTGNLILHMRIHTGEKPFQCELCSKQFATSSNLNAHKKIHVDQRNFPCPQCPKAFKSSTELANHTGTHTGIKNCICKICGKGFYKTSYLNIHMKTVHIGEKRYKCSACSKEFSNSSNLNCHFRIHTGEKPFSCNFCTSQFNQSSALHRHLKQHRKTQLSIKYEDRPNQIQSTFPDKYLSFNINNDLNHDSLLQTDYMIVR